jgi:hypothetical protein
MAPLDATTWVRVAPYSRWLRAAIQIRHKPHARHLFFGREMCAAFLVPDATPLLPAGSRGHLEGMEHPSERGGSLHRGERPPWMALRHGSAVLGEPRR